MTREETLRNLLMSIFGGCTIGVQDNKIDKKISFLSKCQYNGTALNNFRKLFRIAFIEDDPIVLTGNDDVEKDEISFDRDLALKKALRYLEARGINTYGLSGLDQKTQCNYVYSILSGYILPVIMSNVEGLSKTEAGNVDITEQMIYALSQTFPEYGRLMVMNPKLVCGKQNKIEQAEIDKCSKTYNMDIDYSADGRFAILNRFYALSVYYVISKEDNDRLFHDRSAFAQGSLYRAFSESIDSDNNSALACSNIHYFSNAQNLSDLCSWKYEFNRDESKMMLTAKHLSFLGRISDYHCDVRHDAESIIEVELSEMLKPYYVEICDYLEELLKNIISLDISKKSKENISECVLPKDDKLKMILVKKAENLIFDFEIPNHFLRKYRKDDYVNALFIMIRNLIIDVTDLLNDVGEELASCFKSMLDDERYKKHKSVMKRRLNSADFKLQRELEARLFKERREEYRKPETVKDYFYIKHPSVYNDLYYAVENYIDHL